MSSKDFIELELKVLNRDQYLILDDGVKLKSKLWFPSSKGKWPALLMRQPYGKEIASTVTYAHPSWFASHGFLVVVQDVRGQGESEGDFIGFSQEASDTTQTHKWVRNLPECNGLLGTYGFSYQGLTQLLAKAGTPPPECLSPAMTGLNEREHWSCDGGAFWWHIGLSWGLQLAALKAGRNGNQKEWVEIRESLENGSYLRNGPDILEKYDPQGMAKKWLDSSNRFLGNWEVHKPLKSWLKQPMLLIGGWWDPHLIGILDIYQKSLEAGGNPDLYIGPATHLQWWEGTQTLLLNFFKKHLKKPNDFDNYKGEKQLWNLTTKEWQESKSNKKPIPYWGLQTTGRANTDLNDGILEPFSNGAGNLVLVHDPWRPIPAIGGHLSPDPGEVDRNLIDKRFDIATFTSAPLTNSIRIEGRPTLQIEAFAMGKCFDLCVAFSIIKSKENTVTQLSTGFLRIIGEEANERSNRTIKLQPILADFIKGSRLRVSIGGSNWPAIAINPGDSGKECQPPGPNCSVTTICLKTSTSKLYFSPLIAY